MMFNIYICIPIVVSVQKRRSAGRFDSSLSLAETRDPSSLPSGVATCSVLVQGLKQNVKSRIRYN